MIRLSGRAIVCHDVDRIKYIDAIFTEQPYMANVYPGDTREIGVIFKIQDFQVEYFLLGARPIFRETYRSCNWETMTKKGYHITDACIGCGICLDHCPQRCIVEGTPFVIQDAHCLHCGNCCVKCPVQAIERLCD